MSESGDSGGSIDLEAAYAEYFARKQLGEDLELAAFCEEQGLTPDALDGIDAQWELFRRPHADGASLSLSERIRHAFGPAVDPEIELDPEREATEAVDEILGRLHSRRGSFGRHEIKDKVGAGGMGEILGAWDQDLRRNLAMKVMLWQQTKDGHDVQPTPSKLGRFLEEAQITSQLDHPGIVPVHELGLNAEGRLFFTMKLVKGENLDAILDHVEDPGRPEWTLTRGLDVVLKVCEAMGYAHRKGVIHRDLKPANIMVGRFGETYVMDWGLAKVLGRKGLSDIRLKVSELGSLSVVHTDRQDLAETTPASPLMTMDGEVLGTPCYMPPEQARGEVDEMGPASDVYSLGAVLYALLTGHNPYAKRHDKVDNYYVLKLIQAGPPTPVHQLSPRVPAELVAICEKAMAREPGDRYRDTMEMADDLRAYLERRVVRAYKTGAAAEFNKWFSRNKALAVSVAAGLALLIAALVGISWMQRSQKLELQQLSDFAYIDALEARADGLWAARGATAADLEAWLEEADEFLERRALHEAALAEMRTRSVPAPQGGRADGADQAWLRERERLQALRAELSQRLGDNSDVQREYNEVEAALANVATQLSELQDHTFASPTDQWRHDQLVQILQRLDDFVDDVDSGDRDGAYTLVEARLESMQSLEQRSLVDTADAWAEAIASISNPDTCPPYGGRVRIAPQRGLVPLGRNPRTGLWEFAHLQSGELPTVRDNGEIVMHEDSCMVFVLLPGGPYDMGATAADRVDGVIPPAESRLDPKAKDREGPVHRVELDPFFISKYEMTQSQWLRLTGDNPAGWSPRNRAFGLSFDLRHPVESVTWEECVDLMDKAGLALPTEAQWEYGARAGSPGPWAVGADPADLRLAANLMDQANKQVLDVSGWEYMPWDDGWPTTAPVGSFLPNAFGLHDVHGNVWEWCIDTFDVTDGYTVPTRPGDGLRLSQSRFGRSYRGAAFYNVADSARLTNRFPIPGFVNAHGLRPARALDG